MAADPDCYTDWTDIYIENTMEYYEKLIREKTQEIKDFSLRVNLMQQELYRRKGKVNG